MKCEALLYDATTLHGSIIDIEHAISFALEARSSIRERRAILGDDWELYAEAYANYLRIGRILAMHTLFQKPKCPIEKDWYRYKPSKIGILGRWN